MQSFRRRTAGLGVTAGVALLAAGCFGTEEGIELRGDGTVLYTLEYSILETIAPEGDPALSANFLRADSAAGDSVRRREFVAGGDHHFVLERDYASLEHLVAASLASERDTGGGPDAPLKLPLPGIFVQRLDGGRVRLARRMNESTDSSAPDSAMQAIFAGRFYVFRLRAPAIDSASGLVASDRKSAEWRAPLLDARNLAIRAVLVRRPATAKAR